jgi:hypothetical protein
MTTYHMRYKKIFILKNFDTYNSQIVPNDLELQHLLHQPFIHKQRTLPANKEITLIT